MCLSELPIACAYVCLGAPGKCSLAVPLLLLLLPSLLLLLLLIWLLLTGQGSAAVQRSGLVRQELPEPQLVRGCQNE
jgi:hypothetical protein